MAKKKASSKGRKPFKRKVTTITKELVQVDLLDVIEEIEEGWESIKLDAGVLNHNWVSREYSITVEQAKELVKRSLSK